MSGALLINAAELLRRPGTERHVELESTVAEPGLVDPRFDPDAAVEIALRVESLSDGIVVDGRLSVPWADSSRPCLGPAAGEVVCEVHELYQQVITDPDAFEIVGDQIDLGRMVSENILLEAPIAPLCRADCAGLCPTCGTDLNVTTCDCVTTDIDPRWQALSQLKANLPEQ